MTPAPIMRRAVMITRAGGVRRLTPQRRCRGGRELRLPLVLSSHSMFNFSANHLFLLSRTEYRVLCGVPLQDRDTQRVYRLVSTSPKPSSSPNAAYCVAGKVNSAGKLYLVIESVRRTPNTAAFHCSCSC